ncbi:NADH dehydrogenase [ubiquinone] iron-sulfur protein 3, mitochondrial domain protein [Aspergillus niger]|uniref:NADH dehydrogenase [ubiquinone] iron-sulfur protein 3, mitochondrial domain protein n=1 Tax=Aspergillus niger TaxID=5061 RepID=A0A254UK87_ASPNG|nr:hypothetical protein CBS147345_4984 [Aspergillus niger]TPR04708.1 NADH dehydrogenase [ubiquinone] iron-sulfur protein 3, mitochondrial domain protein [Aspergillus niger]SPB51563.1 unnamed protein product [Aspergillus niger]
MISCTTIPVTIPKNSPGGLIPKATAKIIISTFLPCEWPNVDPETLTVTRTTGYANTNSVVERPNPNGSDTPHLEPFKVFLKIHGELDGEIEVFEHLVPSKFEEAQLSHEYGQSGHGAKVLGFFQTQDGVFGRVDEYLDARTLVPQDVEDADTRGDVARALATFHAMDTTILKRSPVQAYYDAVTRELGKYHGMDKLKRLAHAGGICLDHLVDYDFVYRLRRVIDKLESIGTKEGWCIHDFQFMNVLVRNKPQAGESKVVLIDFEFVFRNYRAFDIGAHFLQKLFQWFNEDSQIANCRPYSDEEKRHFCAEYAKQWNQKTGDSDTGEQVFAEAELGFMLAITFEIHNMLCFMDQDDDKDPLNLLSLDKLYREFTDQYVKLGLER